MTAPPDGSTPGPFASGGVIRHANRAHTAIHALVLISISPVGQSPATTMETYANLNGWSVAGRCNETRSGCWPFETPSLLLRLGSLSPVVVAVRILGDAPAASESSAHPLGSTGRRRALSAPSREESANPEGNGVCYQDSEYRKQI